MKTPSCRLITKHLVQISERTVPPETLKNIQIHMSTCPRCEKRVRDFSGLWSELAPPKETRLPVELWPALKQAIEESNGRDLRDKGYFQNIPGLLRPAAAALCFLFALWAGWELGNPPFSSSNAHQLNTLGENRAQEMYISEYLEPFSDLPLGSLADLYLDSDSSDKDTNP